MKMNTQGLNSLEISLSELTEAFRGLPNTIQEKNHHSVAFTVTDDFGNSHEQQLVFTWNQAHSNWGLNTKSYGLFITA